VRCHAVIHLSRLLLILAAASFALVGTAAANHIKGQACSGCASHAEWPRINGVIRKAHGAGRTYRGTSRNDELLGHHGSDTLRGRGGTDVLWGDWDPAGQPGGQTDRIYGGGGTDFIYGSHGRNLVSGGSGNDAISVHYGHGRVDCGPGRDVVHVPRSLRGKYKLRRCEKVDRRSERQRGGGLKPLR
jgi:Ca2+-binding RTX toxin-like protein